jgi:membrane-associated phospholipid phosphatase
MGDCGAVNPAVYDAGETTNIMTAQPWLAGWNYSILKLLFHVLPHRGILDKCFEFLALNHLVSTWIFAAAFFVFWNIEDERTMWRRCRLLQTIVALAVAVGITIVFRPWLAWPAPSLNQSFRNLYPYYFWGTGTSNSFPSHSTLIYLMIAIGFWPLNRRIGMSLIVYTLVAISLPRVYIGGHYPVDVFFSTGFALLMMVAAGKWKIPARLQEFLISPDHSIVRNLFLAFWLFELAEEFGGLMDILRKLRHLA